MTNMQRARQLRAVIEQAATSLPDNVAVTAPALFTTWQPGEAVVPGDRRYYPPTGKLYKVRQGHTTQADWTPDVTQALWAVVAPEAETGTLDSPIAAARGMEYVYGLYYLDPEDGKTYLCQRTGEAEGGTITLAYLPHEVVGNYFEVAV